MKKSSWLFPILMISLMEITGYACADETTYVITNPISKVEKIEIGLMDWQNRKAEFNEAVAENMQRLKNAEYHNEKRYYQLSILKNRADLIVDMAKDHKYLYGLLIKDLNFLETQSKILQLNVKETQQLQGLLKLVKLLDNYKPENLSLIHLALLNIDQSQQAKVKRAELANHLKPRLIKQIGSLDDVAVNLRKHIQVIKEQADSYKVFN